ncbi:ribonuclease H-like domain-containing protein [Tanacetum coccineum]
MIFDDLYNNFKIVEQDVKGTTNSSSSSSSQNMAFVSSPSSTNEVNTTYGVSSNNIQVSTASTQVSTASTQVSIASTQVSTANLSDATVYVFLANQPNGSQLVHEDLEQIHEDVNRIEFNKSEFNLATYKRGLASVEEQLVFYKKNEVIFCEQIVVLKRDISYKDSEISVLKSELEKLKQEKESNQLKIENFDNASKSLDKLIGSQIPDKSRKGVGFVSYNVVPPPPTGLFAPPTLDLSNSGLEEFQQPEFEGYGPKTSKSVSEDISNEIMKSPDAPLVEELVSDDKLKKKTIFPTVSKIEFVRPQQQEKSVRKPVKYAEMYRSQNPRGNQRNWNNQKSQQLGSDFMMYNKACFVYGSFDHVQANCNYHQRERVVSGSNYTRVNYNYSAKKAHPNAHRNMAPRAVLMKTGLRPLNTARPVNTAHPKTTVYSARPMSHFSKSAQSTVKRPYQMRTTLTNKNFSQKVNTTKGKFYTARPKAVNTARPNTAVVNAVRANQVNAVKASACWVWRPTKLNSASITFKRHNYVDARGRSKSSTKEDQGFVDSELLKEQDRNKMNELSGHLKRLYNSDRNLVDKKVVSELVFAQEEGMDYDEVFALVARIKAIRLFLAYASFMGFMVYQMDVKSAFLHGTIEEEVFVCQPTGFKDLDYPNKVYKVVKALYGLHQAPRACRDKYVAEILRKFSFIDVRTASTPMDIDKPLLKDLNGDDVDVHLYISMIRSLMYLTSSRPDIMFTVCACARFQVSLKCKKQTVAATSFTEAEYVAATSCCGQVLWIQNQMLDYGLKDLGKPKRAIVRSRSSGPIPLVANEIVIKEYEDKMERAATTTSSLEVEQDSGSSPRCQDTILGDAEALNSPMIHLS